MEIGEDLLVLTETELTRLSGIGPIIWQSAQRPVSMQTLASRIEAVHGLPEGYEALLDAAVDGLVGRGLLLRGYAVNKHTNAVTVPYSKFSCGSLGPGTGERTKA